MSDKEVVVQPKAPGWLVGVAVAGLVLALGALGWSLGLQNHYNASQASYQTDLSAANQRNAALEQKLEETNERMRAQAETLGQSVGLTQKQLEEKSNQLLAAQRATSKTTAKLAKDQEAVAKEVGDVQTDVSAVKTDVATTKTSVASTQADLENTKSQLTRVVGDQGVMSGLIATNHDELMELKRRGERNYYEFTLHKGDQPQNVGTIKLALKKVDVKKSKYTLNVNSDDRNIEKKDKNLDEPVQFYSGKSPALFEIVVNNVAKNQVTGYLSTPKNVPGPMVP
jgi:cytoskeletal protein RodZ